MKNKLTNSILSNKRNLVGIVTAVFIFVAVLIGLFMAVQPQRSVENFCKAAKEEKGNFKGGSGYDKLLGSFKKLDAVAPKDIHSDTSLIVKGYESIVSDPSKAVSAEFGIIGSQMRVNDYIIKNCPNY
jgi:hypothetical protein